MFENLGTKLQDSLQNFGKKGKVTEEDIRLMTREIQISLLEADVNFKVVKQFVREIKEEASDALVMKGLNTSSQIVKIVKDKLVALLGAEATELSLPKRPAKILMAGLQGAGKTTTSGKLALHLRKKEGFKNPLLVALDVYRPAAITQLQTIGKQIDVPVFTESHNDVLKLAQNALEYAKEHNHDVLIFDTAGRLTIDETMMSEIVEVQKIVEPDETLLVIDAMIGQDAVTTAQHFHNALALTGAIMTKMDGDTRGGAALSIRSVTGVPIKFMGVAEKLDGLERFEPDSVASRILGMTDTLGLISAAEQLAEDDQIKQMEKNMRRKGTFTLRDFVGMNKYMKNGMMKSMIGSIGLKQMGVSVSDDQLDAGAKVFNKYEVIYNSMTEYERDHPDAIGASRRRRIAKGCGLSTNEINKMLKEFSKMQKQMKQMAPMLNGLGKGGGLGNLFGGKKPF